MKRLFFSVVSVALSLGVFAQSVDDGLKAIYYGQDKKAKDIFSKLTSANPADADANYWLGQVLIDDGNIAGAKQLYTKALSATSQNPLIIVGLSHIEVLEGKNVEAKAHFDAALEPTKGRKNKKYGDVKLLAAIGRAEADGGAGIGDPVYGIEKLTQAAELDVKSPELLISKGLCYLKQGGEYGGKAKSSFDDALLRNPNYALAYLRIGKIFESQRNTTLFLENYDKAIEVDPAYAPGYLALYLYYSNRDVEKAKSYLDKYVANVEKDRETDFFYADYLFRAGKYQESLEKAKVIEAGLNGEAYPKIHKLLAYNYNRLGDSITARNEMEVYVNTESSSKISADSYAEMATYLLKTGADDAKTDAMVEKAITSDTVIDNKLDLMRQVATAYGNANKYGGQYKWLRNMMDMRTDTTARNYYYIIDAAIKAENYSAADTFCNMYIASYPDQAQGYYFRSKAAVLADKDTSMGSAISAIDQYNAFLSKDLTTNKNKIITNVGYKVYYYANKSKEYDKAVSSLDEILVVDPTNTYALAAKEQLTKILNKKLALPTPKLGNK